MNKNPCLYLLPNLLDKNSDPALLPLVLKEIIPSLKGLIAESEKDGRRFLSLFIPHPEYFKIPIAVYNQKTKAQDLDFFLDPIAKGETWGFVSDAGLPCIADPGAKLVARAKQRKIITQAFMGPSSFILALMLSGFSGQNFSFHGYFPREETEKKEKLTSWEKISRKEGETQIFMETPYKNLETFQCILQHLQDDTFLCLAWDLTLENENIETFSIREWKKRGVPDFEKKPAVFLISSK